MRRAFRLRAVRALSVWATTATAGALFGCGEQPSLDLSKASSDAEVPVPSVPRPAADGPRLGATANRTLVYDRPSETGRVLGYLHAGATVARAEEPYSKQGCEAGWYPIHPRGFVCAGASATLDLEHPTLIARSIRPNDDKALPYTYARTTKETTLFEPGADDARSVVPVGKLPRRSAMAVVGSWTAKAPDGQAHRLAMMTDGRFVPAADLEALEGSEFRGVEIGAEHQLPVGYVLKRGVRAWFVKDDRSEKRELLEYHAFLPLTGKYRELDGVRFWELDDGRYVRHKDVTVVRQRYQFPKFVTKNKKWVDISVVTGTLVAYEGERPVYASLVSVGRDRLGDPEITESTARGEFPVLAKHVSAVAGEADVFAEGVHLYDVPWVLKLSSGQLMVGAYWHDRFGIEHGPGHLELSPADAAWIWHWVDPAVPEGWHGLAVDESEAAIVNIRK